MGKYNGNILTAYIAPTGIRVAEGENKNGTPNVKRFFTIKDVDGFFSEVQGSPGVYEVVNMSGLVKAIVDALHQHNSTCKRIMVCSNCFGINTDFVSGKGKTSLVGKLTADLTADKNSDNKKKPTKAPGVMVCEIPWGELVEDGKIQHRGTVTTGDKFTLHSLVKEFYHCGYTVVSIADNIGTLINFRHTAEATFDSVGKLVFDFDTTWKMMRMKNDLPIGVEVYQPMTNYDLVDRIDSFVAGALDSVGRNPKIYLTGSLMEDTELYGSVIDKLESAGYTVYDLFDRPKVNPETGKTDEGFTPFTPDFSANIAMLMNAYARNVVTLLPPVEFGDVFEKNSKGMATGFLALSLVCLCIAGYFAGSRFIEMRAIQTNPPRNGSLQAQLESQKSNAQSLQSTIDTLTQADVTVQELMNFVVRNQSTQVTIVSVDTMDMLNDQPLVSGEPVVSSPDDVIEGGDILGPTGIRQPIIIRGYARSGTAAIAYYDKLFNSDIAVDPILNGVEQYKLPNGEEVYIFEIRIGGVFE